ncbi:MAG: beta-ketoacyl-[acyl-carrier-protein] synthase II [Verrucomicrobia bacterium]|nr:beta-ketoacyl-[acyl-carrier-protein] synthase II [Verrucomicrobiota bacterium]
MSSSQPRIVVTGMGAVTPIGIGVENFWTAVCRGDQGIRDVARFDTKDFPFSRGGEIREFALPRGLRDIAGDTDIANQFMLAAAEEAVADASLASTDSFGKSAGVVLSTNFGGYGTAEDYFAMLQGRPNSGGRGFRELSFQVCSDLLARCWKIEGPSVVLSLSCSSGSAAIAAGAWFIRAGRAKVVITGGYDALSRFAWSGLSALRTMAKDSVRPFDLNRSGTIFSEGAGAVIIEERDHALARGAKIHAELAGCGMNNNAYHMTAPAKEGAGSAAAMRMALADGGLDPASVDHVNAHGTGTKPNDVTETQAIKAVFGEHARKIPVTAIKSSTGHMMGAAGSIEAIASILSIRDGVIPPTINFLTPDPECDLDYVLNEKRAANLTTVLSNSAGIGGCNAVVIFRKHGRSNAEA